MIIQTNIYTCDICQKMETETDKVAPYSDPLVSMPKGWELVEGFEFDIICEKCAGKIKGGTLNLEFLREILKPSRGYGVE